MLFMGLLGLCLLILGLISFCGVGAYCSYINYFFSSCYWSSLWVLDKVSVLILLMLLICFFYASNYTHHYFGGDVSGFDLNKLITLFVFVMASLVLTGDFLSTLILWEYLGVVSYFLILFYLSYLSLRASVITLVSSRFGDVCIFLLIGTIVFSNFVNFPILVLLFLIIMTKSAGFPFISWLLEAMRAPTPVSSLVHSSTLVAAGVWFAMRYDVFFYDSSASYLFLLFLTLTIFVTGVCCFFFLDLKKIVALSTCNNISWCVLYLLLGDLTLSLFQLVSHGVSKCLLFMLVGDVMSGSGGSQASNCTFSSPFYGSWGIFGLFSIILGLSGAPYIGVFFTKHFLLSNLNMFINWPFLALVLFCMFLSYFYSFRLCTVLANTKASLSSGVFFCCGAGAMVYLWLFINYIFGNLLDESFSVNSTLSLWLILFQLVSIITSYLLYTSVSFTFWSSSLFGCDNLVETVFNYFYSCYTTLGLFFFRWDKNVLSLLNGTGETYSLKVFPSLINLLMLSSIIILICVSILY
uniref:NADH:ubiquinone reductase (H(+)-translocating) n=1 Tax=Duthiersia expansa TaxID=2015383 RepID=A0A8F7GM39_9CEST|nr:NADH dehydrogenase subunit 5 [Duthiersia expansa]